MLVLSRNVEESIVIECGDEKIVVKVCGFRIEGDHIKVKLGFEASLAVSIWRDELYPPRSSEVIE